MGMAVYFPNNRHPGRDKHLPAVNPRRKYVPYLWRLHPFWAFANCRLKRKNGPPDLMATIGRVRNTTGNNVKPGHIKPPFWSVYSQKS